MLFFFRNIFASIGFILFTLNLTSYSDQVVSFSGLVSDLVDNWRFYVEELWRRISNLLRIPFWAPAAPPVAFFLSFLILALSSVPTVLGKTATLGPILLMNLREYASLRDFERLKFELIRQFKQAKVHLSPMPFELSLGVVAILAAFASVTWINWYWSSLILLLQLIVYGVAMWLSIFVAKFICIHYASYKANEWIYLEEVESIFQRLGGVPDNLYKEGLPDDFYAEVEEFDLITNTATLKQLFGGFPVWLVIADTKQVVAERVLGAIFVILALYFYDASTL